MKRKIALLFGLLMILVIQEANSWDLPLDIDIVSIAFDFETGYTDDALDIRKNASTNIATPEWLPPSRNNPLAYIKSQTNRHIYVSFIHNQGAGNVCNMVVRASAGGYYPGTIQETDVYFPSCGTTASAELILSGGSTPSYVQKWGFSMYWYVTEVNDQPQSPNLSIGTTGNHLYYTLLAAPQSPMSEPWTDVLDYSCVWSANQSTNSSALTALTTKLYIISGLYYNGGQSHYNPDRWPNPTKFVFDLTDFLYDWQDADCQDCSMFLSILSSSIGASLTQTRRIQGSFNTKSILPIGWSSWTNTGWNFHHIGWLNNVYDPCIKLKPSSPYIPIDKNIDNPYKADLYSSGSWSPKNAFRLGQTDPYWNVPTEIQ